MDRAARESGNIQLEIFREARHLQQIDALRMASLACDELVASDLFSKAAIWTNNLFRLRSSIIVSTIDGKN